MVCEKSEADIIDSHGYGCLQKIFTVPCNKW